MKISEKKVRQLYNLMGKMKFEEIQIMMTMIPPSNVVLLRDFLNQLIKDNAH